MTMSETKNRLLKSLGEQEKSKKTWMDDFHFGKHHQNILKGGAVLA